MDIRQLWILWGDEEIDIQLNSEHLVYDWVLEHFASFPARHCKDWEKIESESPLLYSLG